MIHHHTYGIAPYTDLTQLVTALCDQTWTTCQGFSWSGLLLLNDSFSADGAQEYAVIRGGRQIESLTVSWMTAADLATTLQDLAAGGGGDYGPCHAVLESLAQHHRCTHCA